MNEILLYERNLKEKARKLRNSPTQSEEIIWYSLKGNQLGVDFHRQKPLGYYIYDFFCEEVKLLIELDGVTHDNEEVKINDRAKEIYARSLGFTLLRFRDEEVFEAPERVIGKIKNYIKEFEKNRHTTLHRDDTPPAPSREGEKQKTMGLLKL